MSLYDGPAEHAANPPESWTVEKVGTRWRIRDASGHDVGSSHETKRAALDATSSGFYFDLWHTETRWYTGATVGGWKPYADCIAERERSAARRAERNAGAA